MPVTKFDSSLQFLVPPDVLALFGESPLLGGEDDGSYHTLMERFAELVEPNDIIEWCWVKDLTDHAWEIRRLRRFKVWFFEIQTTRRASSRRSSALDAWRTNRRNPKKSGPRS